LREAYPDTVRIAYKMHPLPNHPFAMVAAQAALAAQQQGKFLEMHEKLLGSMRNFNSLSGAKATEMGLEAGQARAPQVQKAMFTDFAEEMGLDAARFQSDMDDPKLIARIKEETREVVAVGAGGTPASFINGKYLSGAQPFNSFKAVVDKALGGSGATAANP
jgi:protein-disulfide isomerase